MSTSLVSTLYISRREQYGRVVYHPDCRLSRQFAALIGTKTLTTDALVRITAMGFKVSERSTPCAFDVQAGAALDSQRSAALPTVAACKPMYVALDDSSRKPRGWDHV